MKRLYLSRMRKLNIDIKLLKINVGNGTSKGVPFLKFEESMVIK